MLRNKFQAHEEESAFEQLKSEWNSFKVPELIHSRIRELFWEHYESDDTVKILVEEFEMKECYASKCYYFSEANQYKREILEKVGMFYNCSFCSDSCTPKLKR